MRVDLPSDIECHLSDEDTWYAEHCQISRRMRRWTGIAECTISAVKDSAYYQQRQQCGKEKQCERFGWLSELLNAN